MTVCLIDLRNRPTMCTSLQPRLVGTKLAIALIPRQHEGLGHLIHLSQDAVHLGHSARSGIEGVDHGGIESEIVHQDILAG